MSDGLLVGLAHLAIAGALVYAFWRGSLDGPLAALSDRLGAPTSGA